MTPDGEAIAVTFGAKMYAVTSLATGAVVGAGVLALFRLWMLAGLLAVVASVAYAVVVRIARSGTESERRAVVDSGERAIGAVGRAGSAGWTPRRREVAWASVHE